MTGAHAGVVHDLVVHGHEVGKAKGGPALAEAPRVAGHGRARGLLSWVITALIAVAAFVLVSWAGVSLNTVSTSSMVPTYKPTDMLLTLGPKAITPGVGDAIVFETDYVGQHIPPHVHRIVAQNSDGTWTTKGDANPEPDGWRVKQSDVKGVVVASMPSRALRNPVLIGLLLFGVLAIGLWPRDKGPKASDGENGVHPGDTGSGSTDAAKGSHPGHAFGRPHHAGAHSNGRRSASVVPPPHSHRAPNTSASGPDHTRTPAP